LLFGDASPAAAPVVQHLKNFFIPRRYPRSDAGSHSVRVAAIIPAFKPDALAIQLVRNLIHWNPDIAVYVVDDCTPEPYEALHNIFAAIRSISRRVTVLRTPANRMKAGAINYALETIYQFQRPLPDAILTLDDDVVITPRTVRNLMIELFSADTFGAVCSQCRVLNKNANFLTRLQGLEYIGFNATRIADEGFFQGPLVMHGMLTAFRTEALRTVGKFTENHLIEDYEITTRLKRAGWHVKSAPDAVAWTKVPERLGHLWRQRTRWLYGGIIIVTQIRYWRAVVQDLIGHGLFLATLGVIGASFLAGNGTVPAAVSAAIIVCSLVQFVVWYLFNLWLMRFYPERDRVDWLIRASIIPEFLYANLLTLILLGAYLFFIFTAIAARLTRAPVAVEWGVGKMRSIFGFLGYTERWGTRSASS